MAVIFNLRQAKKEAARKAARATADANAVKFGLTRAERELQKARTEKAKHDLEAHRRGMD
jgi:Domain of unknown function (DUF4169)